MEVKELCAAQQILQNLESVQKAKLFTDHRQMIQLYFKSNDVYNEWWQNAWIIPAFWQVLSFSLLCVICALWAPSQTSTRYDYSSEDADEVFDKDNTLTLIKPSSLTSKDVKSPEPKSIETSSGLSQGDLEEKTE